MKKTIPNGFSALFIIFLFLLLLASCGPIFDVGGDVNGGGGGGGSGGGVNPPPSPPPAGGYVAVKAFDWLELADYLQSDEISYAITLTEMENTNIYLQRNLSIVKPMKIIGKAGQVYTIHSTNREGGSAFFCLDLQADLELEYCGFTGYNGTSGSGSGIAAGSPPLNIRAGSALTMTGRNSVLELRGIGGGTDIRPGAQVILGDGVVFADASGDLLFRAGVEKLIIDGIVYQKNKLTVGSGAALCIEYGGELRVEPGATLTLDKDIKELRLDGDIVVDRTAGSVGNIAFTGGLDSLLGKITGENGSLSIENEVTGIIIPFDHGVNTIIKLSSNGISLGKKESSEIGGVVNLAGSLTIPKEKRLVVGAGTDFHIKDKTLTLEGGTLDIEGNVTTTGGQIILSAEKKYEGTPRGELVIENNGCITIGDGGKFIHEFLELTPSGAASPFTISGPAITFSGNVNLTAAAPDSSLTGTFTVASGSALTIIGNLTVRAPNVLNGVITNQGAAPKIDTISGCVYFYSNATAANPSSTLSGAAYSWSAAGWIR